MRFKYYMAFVVVFCVVLGIYAYTLELGNFALTLPTGRELDLPVSLWLIILILVFCLCSSILFASSWASSLMRSYRTRNDFSHLFSQINEQALNKPIESRVYKNPDISKLSKILARFYLKPRLDSNECFEPKIDKLFENYKDVMSGKSVDLRAYNLSKDNKFSIQNLKNKIQSDSKCAFNALSDTQPQEIRDFAVVQILTHGSSKDIERLLSSQVGYNASMKPSLIHAFIANHELFSPETLSRISQQMSFNAQDYVQLAQQSKDILEPHAWYKLLESLANADEHAENALFYVMFELEMIDKVRERRALHGKDEYRLIDAYLDLKDSGKHYPLDIFFNQCNI
ncbi:hypothetical protein [uncultured Helicobacter sp.]|uniref:hypothetical protein n=1 Tax=uncultured Helicobacter sp. TaxID=175537 RepID=UPI00375327C4